MAARGENVQLKRRLEMLARSLAGEIGVKVTTTALAMGASDPMLATTMVASDSPDASSTAGDENRATYLVVTAKLKEQSTPFE